MQTTVSLYYTSSSNFALNALRRNETICFLFDFIRNKRKEGASVFLSVRFGDTFEFVLLLDSIGVGRSLGGIDEFVSQALGNSLDVSE